MTISIAHRGDCSHHPENTIEAFWSAQDAGVDMIETDIRISRDGRAILLHDPTLYRVWGVSKRVSHLTWEEISGIERNGHQVPLLETVLRETSLRFMLDFTQKNVVDELIRILKRQPSLDRFLVVSGNVKALYKAKQLLPEITTGLTWNKKTFPEDALLEHLQVGYFNPDYRLVDSKLLDFVRQKQLKLSCWTVDRLKDMRELKGLGVDAIVSNEVSDLVKVLKD